MSECINIVKLENISDSVTEADLLQLFAFTEVSSISLVTDDETSQFLGYAHIEVTSDAIDDVLFRLNGMLFEGHVLRASLAHEEALAAI